VTKDGVRLDVAFSISLLHGNSGQSLGFALLVRDVTERKAAEAEVRRVLVERERRERQQAATSEIRLALLSGAPIDEVLDLTCARACELLDAENTVVALVQEGELRITAATQPHLVGAVFAIDASLTVPIASGEVVHGSLSLVRAAGAPLVVDDDANVLQGLADQVALALELGTARDLRDRMLLIDDRERIAHSLHDDVIQQLFGVSLRLQNLAGLSGDPRVAAQVTEMIDDLDATIRRIRAAVFELQSRNHTS
jgi:signal transduction histidine kinase